MYLLVPSRTKPWPLLLSSLSDFHSSPVRLRNGKVALLINNNDLELLHNSIHGAKKSKGQKLNALSGFESDNSKVERKKPVIVLLVVAMVAVVIWVAPKPVVADIPVLKERKKPETSVRCGIPIQVNAEVVGVLAKNKLIKLGGFDYKIANTQKLGGLIQLKLKRKCDQKYFRVDAWSETNQVTVSKVY